MVVRVLLEWTFVLQWPALLFLQTLCSLILSTLLVMSILAIDPHPGVILLTSSHSFYFTQSFIGILQLQVLTSCPVKLVYALTFFLLELIPKQGFVEHPIREVS